MTNMNIHNLGIYAIRDKSIGMFLPPFLAASDVEAKRLVAQSIEPGSFAARFPADFHLVRCGVFNSATGMSRDPEDNVTDVICSVTDILKSEIIEETHNMEVANECSK